MLYLIGIGLEKEDISLKALKTLRKCKEIYIETYTTFLPFSIKQYENFISKVLNKKIKIKKAERPLLEEKSQEFIEKARNKDIALLVYGDPLFATTHIALIKEAKEKNIKYAVIHSPSVINAISDFGLSLYKFGKIASMPKWEKNYKPKSFYEIIKENKSMDAHTLLLIDPSLSLTQSLNQLIKSDKEKIIDEIFICSKLGTKNKKILKINIKKIKKVGLRKLKNKLKNKIKKPFCFIIPSSISFYENKL